MENEEVGSQRFSAHEETQESIRSEETDDEDLPEQGAADANDPNSAEAMERAMAEMLLGAETSGASKFVMNELKQIVMSYSDVFRNELGRDSPANVPPMVIDIIDEEKVEKRVRVRRFTPLQMQFLVR